MPDAAYFGPVFVGSVVLGEPAVPAGVFGDIVPDVPEPVPLPIAVPEVADPLGELIEPVVPAGVSDEGLPIAPVVAPVVPVVPVVPLPIDPLVPDVDDEPLVSLPVAGVLDDGVAAVLPVLDVVDGFDIELSVFGASALLQAPSAASVAAMASHLIERCMFSPRWWDGGAEPAPHTPRVASA